MRHRVSAVIIKDKKLLVVKGANGFYDDFYFTPGGGVKDGESERETLSRECNEELGIIPVNPKPYVSYEAVIQNTDQWQRVSCFLVESFTGEPQPDGHEVHELFWYGRENFERNDPAIAKSMYKHLVPALIKDGKI
jgi:ADP-ribose pyrophosphatase YjhB (NUDIX family)